MRYAGAFIVLVFAAGCGGRSDLEDVSGDGVAPDGSLPVDGGSAESAPDAEAGVSTDGEPVGQESGPIPVDARPDEDSGPVAKDSSTIGEDSGPLVQDGGTPDGDSEAVEEDSATADVDGGPVEADSAIPAGDSGPAEDSSDGGTTGDDGGPIVEDSGSPVTPIVCGNATCDPAAECCLQIGPGTSCTPVGSCPGVALPCTGADNCSTGQVCCIQLGGGGGTPASRCEPTCAAGGGGIGLQLCNSSSECPGREPCIETPLGVHVCFGLAGAG